MRRLLIVIFAFLSTKNAFAQQEAGTFTIQPKVGLNVASVTGTVDNGANKGFRLGLAAGVELEYKFTKTIGVSFGALYSMQGVNASTTLEGTKLTETARLDYINIPIMLNGYVAEGVVLKFGIQPAFRVNDGYTMSAQGQSLNGKLSDLGFEINSFDFSFPVGLSFEFSNVILDARYNIGITEVSKGGGRNNVFQFTLGYKFKL